MDLYTWGIVGSFGLASLEGVYSILKKDRIHRLLGTLGNLARGVVLLALSSRTFPFYFALLYPWLEANGYLLPSNGHISTRAFLLCLLCIDLCWYCFHRIHHAWSFFWTFHSVHHGDNAFNLSSAFRISWLEQLYLFFFYAPVLLLGFHPSLFFLAIFYLNFHQFFCHSQYIRLPRFFDWIFVTPHNHRIHHDQALVHQQGNFGAIFSLWDRLFGTYIPAIETFTPGIKGYHQDDFIKMETDPILAYLKKKFGRY